MIKRSLSLLLLLFAGAVFTGAQVLPQIDTSVRPAISDDHHYVPLLVGKNVALVINQTSEYKGTLLLDMVLQKGVKVVKIFVPEHGFRGTADAGAHIANGVDAATGIPVISLYGAHKKPTKADLDDVDVLVYDLQDVGARFYTYISTLQYCMEACGEYGKQMVILDRPNPNGHYVDGPVAKKEQFSFVGMQPIPVVYGMTPGEYAGMIAGERWISYADKLQLVVIPCYNYTHKKMYRLPVQPSPNLRTMEAVYAYPSLCFFEGTPISVGRGTDIPFRVFGCPEFKDQFNYSFTPHSMPGATQPPYKDKECYGMFVAPDEETIKDTINNKLHLSWLLAAYNAYPDKTHFFQPFFTKLAGTSGLASQCEQGMSEKEIRATWQADITRFKKIRKRYLLYPDFE